MERLSDNFALIQFKRIIMDVEIQKLSKILNKIEKSGCKKFSQLKVIKSREKLIYSGYYWEVIALILAFFACIASWNYDLFMQNSCLIEFPVELRTKLFRRPENCEFCENVKEITYLEKLTPDLFEKNYAYTATPVIVTDAMENWTAPEMFDYWYFKSVYKTARRKHKTLNCQFFPYKSGIKSLYDAFDLPPERVEYEKGTEPWYFGWSNCNPDVAKILRQHYGRPYFLPKSSENTAVDWIFIGGHGLGAHMHVDNVRLPSWQAQLRGMKKWILAPPPECYYRCSSFEAVVKPGDISMMYEVMICVTYVY